MQGIPERGPHIEPHVANEFQPVAAAADRFMHLAQTRPDAVTPEAWKGLHHAHCVSQRHRRVIDHQWNIVVVVAHHKVQAHAHLIVAVGEQVSASVGE
ncbi:hypothetical protein D9M69_726380 [compost metagenome]